MPGAATHIAVADRMYRILGDRVIQNLPFFFGGSIAPDAIHARPGYKRADKKHTHLTEGITGDTFHNPEKLKLFHNRVNEFISKYYRDTAEDKDLYLGYIIHLLTDELFYITKRTPFSRLLFKEGSTPREKTLFTNILSDIEKGDKLILANYAYTANVVETLDAVWDYEIQDYMSKNEINNSKHYIISKFMNANRNRVSPPQELRYYSYEEAVDFIDYAVNDIIERLSGCSVLLRIL